MDIKIPDEVRYIINTLEKSGYEAYAVGGSVRDAVLGKTPKDWDICTSALPEQAMKCFLGERVIETGLKHGTISLLQGSETYEITTFRADGIYTDNRRPDMVTYINDLKGDLSRRDFTINAMAYHPDKGVLDFFGGLPDINSKTIRCVGNPEKRFSEDALRIMRALRFSSVLDFSIDKVTSDAISGCRRLLHNIAAERLAAELNALIMGSRAGKVLLEYAQVIGEIIPEINDMVGFEQNNPHHDLDVWKHTVKSVDNVPPELVLRLTMLFHDIGKPRCYTEEDSLGHFHGHPNVSESMAKDILLRLRYDSDTIQTVTQLIIHHDAELIPNGAHIKRWLNKIGEKRLRQLIDIKRADAMAQSEQFRQAKLSNLEAAKLKVDEIISSQQCFTRKDLAVDGSDLIAAGVPAGTEVGRILGILLDMVIDEKIENDSQSLLEKVRENNIR